MNKKIYTHRVMTIMRTITRVENKLNKMFYESHPDIERQLFEAIDSDDRQTFNRIETFLINILK